MAIPPSFAAIFGIGRAIGKWIVELFEHSSAGRAVFSFFRLAIRWYFTTLGIELGLALLGIFALSLGGAVLYYKRREWLAWLRVLRHGHPTDQPQAEK